MTTTVFTRLAADALGHIHYHRPVIAPPDPQDDWLDPKLTEKGEIRMQLDGIPDPEPVPREVGQAVGNVRNNGAALIEPLIWYLIWRYPTDL